MMSIDSMAHSAMESGHFTLPKANYCKHRHDSERFLLPTGPVLSAHWVASVAAYASARWWLTPKPPSLTFLSASCISIRKKRGTCIMRVPSRDVRWPCAQLEHMAKEAARQASRP